MKKILFTLCFLFFASTCFAEGNVSPEWLSAGFNDYDASMWQAVAFDVPAAKAWKEAGFAPSTAVTWQKKHISPADAGKWKAAGAKDAKQAAKLAKAGLTPETYKAANPKGDLGDDEVIEKAGKGK